MTYRQAIDILRRHNEWRRYNGPIGEGPEMVAVKELGEAIDKITSLGWLDMRFIVETADNMLDNGETFPDMESYYSKVLSAFLGK